MSASIQARAQRIERILSVLAAESSRGVLVIVEGARDKESLRGLGVKGRILCIKAGRERMLEKIERGGLGRRAIVLTDFDEEGRRLAHYLEVELTSRGVAVDLRIWKELRSLSRSDVVGIEDLAGFVLRMRVDVGGSSAQSLGRHYVHHVQEPA